MATFRNADQDAIDLIEQLIGRHHADLQAAGVTVGALFAFAPTDKETGEPKGPALKKYGMPAVASVRVVNQKDRVAGLPDAQILVDGEAWKDWSEDRQAAVIDRQLLHLEVKRDEDGQVKLDDCFRPKLKLRPPDWLVSGFETIARRHGEASLEVMEARSLADEWGNLLFDFAPDAFAAEPDLPT